MNYINMGKSGLNVSQLGLGCIDFGTRIQQEQAFRIIDAYRENGGNLLDTANNYAFWNGGDGRDKDHFSSVNLVGKAAIHKEEKCLNNRSLSLYL